jgi:heat shock protein HslJ
MHGDFAMRRPWTALVIAATIAAAGCSTHDDNIEPNREVTTLAQERIEEARGPLAPAAPAGVASQSAKQWMFTSVHGFSGQMPKGNNNASMLLSRGSGRVVGSTSCNRMSATFRMNAQSGTIHFDNIVTDNKMCGEPNRSVEDAVVEALRTCDGFRMDGKHMSLFSGGDVVAELVTP